MLRKVDLIKVKAPILLTGETGTGKSSLVRELAQLKQKKLVEINLATLSETLFESELFGHKKGAFTGAHEDKSGYLDQVGEGILFLDEIGELSLSTQKKLLQLLEDRCFYPLGSSQKKFFKGEIILATHRELKDLVAKKEFRADLYFRISTFPFHLKSLREEPEIILSLSYQILTENFGRHELKLSEEVREKFLNYDWPGNKRELKNCLEYAQTFAQDWISLEHLPEALQENNGPMRKSERILTYPEALEQFERDYFHKAMQFYSGKINLSSLELKISKVTLISKLRKYQLNSLLYKAKKREIELASVPRAA